MENKGNTDNKNSPIKETKKPNTNKWDNYLIDYNNYLKTYIKHYKRSVKGNLKSLAIYPYMKLKAEVIRKKLIYAERKNILNNEQLKKLSKIKLKIIKIFSN